MWNLNQSNTTLGSDAALDFPLLVLLRAITNWRSVVETQLAHKKKKKKEPTTAL